ncbi:MAG TPA: LuxR C-terminal-related transcriptional regulator, partial [Actinomycetota bacterium]|nr:LuxR C-terminal-related transcriptional regulator [Actinomycetota bacterium]
LHALREAADGEMVLVGPPREFVGAIAHGLEHPDEVSTRLTERERQVLTVAAEGLTAREIATRLGVQERTVTTHLGKIYGKLGVGTRVAALRVAARSGLVSVGSET